MKFDSRLLHIVYWASILSVIAGCEIYSDALIRPEYQPSMILHDMLSPQEGGQAYIKYSEPIESVDAELVPELPEFSVFLYENGVEKYEYTHLEEWHLILDTTDLLLYADRDYHMEVWSDDGQLVLKSGIDHLPPVPDVLVSRLYQDTSTFPEKNFVEVAFRFDPQSSGAFHFRNDYSVDSGRVFIRGRDLMYGRFSLGGLYDSRSYPDGMIHETLSSATFIKPEPGSENQFVNAVKLWIDHLSPGLTRFLQDVADFRDSGGDPFSTSKPVYSNIEGGYGVFGMYNSWVGEEYIQ